MIVTNNTSAKHKQLEMEVNTFTN